MQVSCSKVLPSLKGSLKWTIENDNEKYKWTKVHFVNSNGHYEIKALPGQIEKSIKMIQSQSCKKECFQQNRIKFPLVNIKTLNRAKYLLVTSIKFVDEIRQ